MPFKFNTYWEVAGKNRFDKYEFSLIFTEYQSLKFLFSMWSIARARKERLLSTNAQVSKEERVSGETKHGQILKERTDIKGKEKKPDKTKIKRQTSKKRISWIMEQWAMSNDVERTMKINITGFEDYNRTLHGKLSRKNAKIWIIRNGVGKKDTHYYLLWFRGLKCKTQVCA